MLDLFPLSALLALTALAGAQDPALTAVTRAYGITPTAAGLHAGGPGYSATFDAQGVVFMPMLGSSAPRTLAVRWHLAAVRRGDQSLFEAGVDPDVAPVQVGQSVQYRHSAGLVEAYDVRQDGIEQTFRLAQRPAGTGDLVVELALDSDLPLVSARTDGLRFELAGLGGVTFGAVTGVDANLATTTGTVHVVEDRIRLTLPAAFVDHAAYPLVLDPLVGGYLTVGNGNGADDLPSAAFDEGTGRYLVVWTSALSSTTAEIRAQYVSANGSIFGPMFIVATDANPGTRPGIANVNTTDRYLVAWCTTVTGVPFATGSVKVRSIQAGSMTMSAVLTRSHANSLTSHVSIGGDGRLGAFGAAQRAMVVYREQTLFGNENKVHMWCVHVPSTGNPTTFQNQEIASTTVHVDQPAVSRHCGANGNWLVAYARSGSGIGTTPDQIRARMVDTDGVLCGTTAVVDTFAIGVQTPCVATVDGEQFLVAWVRGASPNGGDVFTRRLRWTGQCSAGAWILATTADPTPTTAQEAAPSLDFAAGKFVLAWAERDALGINQRVMARSLALDGQASGATHLMLTPPFTPRGSPVVAAKASASAGTDDEALLVWDEDVIRGQLFEAQGTGLVTSLGGACGIPGLSDVATWSGTPVLGSNTFALELLAPTSPILGLAIGFSQASLPCGPCTLVPSLDILLPGVTPTPFPIPHTPSLIDFEIFTQWLQLRPSGCPILPDIGLSQALKFTIKE
jgi:hypothetical protein